LNQNLILKKQSSQPATSVREKAGPSLNRLLSVKNPLYNMSRSIETEFKSSSSFAVIVNPAFAAMFKKC
jgi:hypothetical protein